MDNNVRLTHTRTGAVTKVRFGAFEIRKPYSTMEAAMCEAVQLGLISFNQQTLLERNCIAKAQSLSTYAPGIIVSDLFNSGFGLSTTEE